MDMDIVHVHSKIRVHVYCICPVAWMSVSMSAAISVSFSVFTVILMFLLFCHASVNGPLSAQEQRHGHDHKNGQEHGLNKGKRTDNLYGHLKKS